MPEVVCSTCSKMSDVDNKDWKLIDPTSAYFCSSDCLLKAIYSNKPQSSYLFNMQTIRTGTYYSKKLKTFFMSKYEETVALFLAAHNIWYQYEAYWFPIVKTIYIPDFYLPDYGCFLEVKGAYGIGSKNKLASFRIAYPDETLFTVSWHMRHMFS